jgi:hypothetical protein
MKARRDPPSYQWETGGFPLVPLHSCVRAEHPAMPTDCPFPAEGLPWDFSVNILNSSHPEASPHWRSPRTNTTYATAVELTFGERVVAEVGQRAVFLYAVSECAEAVLSGSTENVVAVTVWDRRRTEAGAKQIGIGVLEQYGYN